jgi:hypothetical protein
MTLIIDALRDWCARANIFKSREKVFLINIENALIY